MKTKLIYMQTKLTFNIMPIKFLYEAILACAIKLRGNFMISSFKVIV